MKRVPLTQGKFALVDEEDFERVMQHKWYAIDESRYRNTTRTFSARRTVVINGKKTTMQMTRFILQTDAKIVDHEDHDGLNNQKYNLRPCSNVDNGRNRLIQNHSTPFKGVTFHKLMGKFRSRITINQKTILLGDFDDPQDAARAYDAAAIQHFGAFAKTNQQLGAL